MFADQRHAAFKVTWNVYQKVIDAYQTELPTKEKKIMTQLITSLHSSIPTGLQKLRSLGQTMTRHRDDILAFSSTTPAPATAPPKRSTASSNASEEQPEDSAASPTTSPDPYSTPAGSDPSSTHSCEEPLRPRGRHASRKRAAINRVPPTFVIRGTRFLFNTILRQKTCYGYGLLLKESISRICSADVIDTPLRISHGVDGGTVVQVQNLSHQDNHVGDSGTR